MKTKTFFKMGRIYFSMSKGTLDCEKNMVFLIMQLKTSQLWTICILWTSILVRVVYCCIDCILLVFSTSRYTVVIVAVKITFTSGFIGYAVSIKKKKKTHLLFQGKNIKETVGIISSEPLFEWSDQLTTELLNLLTAPECWT